MTQAIVSSSVQSALYLLVTCLKCLPARGCESQVQFHFFLITDLICQWICFETEQHTVDICRRIDASVTTSVFSPTKTKLNTIYRQKQELCGQVPVFWYSIASSYFPSFAFRVFFDKFHSGDILGRKYCGSDTCKSTVTRSPRGQLITSMWSESFPKTAGVLLKNIIAMSMTLTPMRLYVEWHDAALFHVPFVLPVVINDSSVRNCLSGLPAIELSYSGNCSRLRLIPLESPFQCAIFRQCTHVFRTSFV